ncbi:cob(I)yrinic acid a,c-diamide adenosyltransferase [Alterisphingorhabdus coralli]|uniref:Corrinoid adenosyltransferase n=1 Tax=Alterisphingorhabdus coralli TaxID=3071408 RepID=A0AA97F953_9SPHN|nr:cob(I)yrinic acid a,c-diamide adenosyltransferase [Parasphingorhabdus sp. SCSIO 66989]WOE75816.1 cob(I)yrinic acid a,c-diamide adenosyltransferase [Parasphingorhabdus sp. SCSIO 66989]
MVKLNKIYTRTGDDGTTGLADGSRIGKSEVRVEAIGDVDELNSLIGVALVEIGQAESFDPETLKALRRIQNDLFDLGADIATPGDDFEPSDMALRMVSAQVQWLEQEIDRINDQLEPLTSFILPGGSHAAAASHVARATARRAERKIVALADEQAVNPFAAQYINRLSDFLFVLARYINKASGGDPLWVPGASR